LVQNKLVNGYPVLTNPTSGNGNIQSAASFDEWFTPTPDAGAPITEFSFVLQGVGLNFLNDAFYPLNNIGFQDSGPLGNTYYTLHLQANFTLTSQSQLNSACFQFGSSDDLWAFIDGCLYSDIGGVHPFTFTSATGAPANLQLNVPHTLDVFYASRSLEGAGISIKTNVPLVPTSPTPLGVAIDNGATLSSSVTITGYATCQFQVYLASGDGNPHYGAVTFDTYFGSTNQLIGDSTLLTLSPVGPSQLAPLVWIIPVLEFPEAGEYIFTITAYESAIIYGVELHCGEEQAQCLSNYYMESFAYARSSFEGQSDSFYSLIKAESLEINAKLGSKKHKNRPVLNQVGVVVEKDSFIRWNEEEKFPTINSHKIDLVRNTVEVSPNNYVAIREIADPRKGHKDEKLTYLFIFTEDYSVIIRRVPKEGGARFDLHVRAIEVQEIMELEIRKDLLAEGVLLDPIIQQNVNQKQVQNRLKKYKISSLLDGKSTKNFTNVSPKILSVLNTKIEKELQIAEKEFN